MEETQLVTCLCLTMAGRSEFLKRAIDSYLNQTYERKELLIMPDSIMELDSRLTGEIPPGRNINLSICGLTLGNQGRNIGTKRNLGCASASGDLVAIWDDDDFSAPCRLEFQVQSLQVSRKAVTGFQIMKFTDNSSWWRYQAENGFVVGSSLMFKRDWWVKHPFPELQIGEDVQFCDVAHSAGELAMCPDMDLMYATIHSGNTSLRRPGDHPHNYTSLPGYSFSVTSAPR